MRRVMLLNVGLVIALVVALVGAFAVLLMNAATPIIDQYVKPRIYGRDRKGAALSVKKEA